MNGKKLTLEGANRARVEIELDTENKSVTEKYYGLNGQFIKDETRQDNTDLREAQNRANLWLRNLKVITG